MRRLFEGILIDGFGGEVNKHLNGCLYVITKDTETFIDINDFDAIVVDTTQISITSSSMLYATENKVPIIFCNSKHMPQAFCFDIFMNYKTSQRISEQIKWSTEKKQYLWNEIIKEKINGQRNNLLNLNKNIKISDSLLNYIEMLNYENCETNIQEAVSARLYFKEMFGVNFIRHNEDTINYALNYGYSLLRSYICCIITAKGLHPSIGISHHNILNTYNFADDIIEIFRPLVDLVVHEQIEYYEDFSKEFRKSLLDILTKDIYYKGEEVNIKRAVNLFIDNIINFFNNDVEIIIPKLEVLYAV